jgi:hypothetical protein
VVRQSQIQQRLQGILGDLVARERAGELVDRALLKATTQVRLCAADLSGGRDPSGIAVGRFDRKRRPQCVSGRGCVAGDDLTVASVTFMNISDARYL